MANSISRTENVKIINYLCLLTGWIIVHIKMCLEIYMNMDNNSKDVFNWLLITCSRQSIKVVDKISNYKVDRLFRMIH